MPFAAAVLSERAEDYYFKPKPMAAPYMIVAFDSHPETRHKYLAVQRPYDYSVRPQEVSESWNPDFYRLIKYYEEITGEGIVLNTSFNLHRYPIVYQPAGAIGAFGRSGLQYLALGNWWVWHELGANYFDEHRREHLVDRLTRRLQHLGYRVSLEPVAAV